MAGIVLIFVAVGVREIAHGAVVPWTESLAALESSKHVVVSELFGHPKWMAKYFKRAKRIRRTNPASSIKCSAGRCFPSN